MPIRLAIACAAAVFASTAAQASVVISNATTRNMSCASGTCTPTAKNAVLNVGDLQTMLASGDVTVETASGAQTIAVTAPLTWASTSRLTLSSVHSVSFKAGVVVEGTAGLTLATDGHQPGGDVLFYPGGSVTFWDPSSSLVIDGTSYTLVNDIATLAADIASDSSGAYALAKDYDASADGSYARAPVGVLLRGRFEGLGHAIQNLSIDLTHTGKSIQAALFHGTGGKGIIRDVTLVDVAIAANPSANQQAAPLVGSNGGAIVNSSATGSIDASTAGGRFAGLVVVAQQGSKILNSWSAVSISASPYHGAAVGGLVELNQGSITNSYATGTLAGPGVGGLVYDNNGAGAAITGSHAAATLTGNGAGGAAGLALFNEGTISASYSTSTFSSATEADAAGLVVSNAGAVSNSWSNSDIALDSGGGVAGLVAQNLGTGTIVNSYATGNLTSGNGGSGVNVQMGGLTVFNQGSISQSYATGSVTDAGPHSQTTIGGFAGANEGTIADCYALGAVSGNPKAFTAGFAGALYSGSIATSYSTGFITGGLNPNTEGFVAFTSGGTVSDGYWDVDTSGQNKSKAGTPIHDADLKSALPAGFDPGVWAQSPSVNSGYPYLIANPPH